MILWPAKTFISITIRFGLYNPNKNKISILEGAQQVLSVGKENLLINY